MLPINSFVILNNMIQKEPGIIVGPISWLLGQVLNFVYNIVYAFTTNHSLGLSIIFLTIFVRALMIPLAYKQQKSMFAMQKIQPEIKKIQDKYKNAGNDPEIQRKITTETQKLYSKHNYNPFSGCLPMIIQLPIFISLYYIMQNSYSFIDVIGDTYNQIGTIIQGMPNFAETVVPLAVPKVPKNMEIDIAVLSDLTKVLNKFTVSDWETIKTAFNNSSINDLLATKESIEFFFGMNLTEKVGLSFPKILIPIFSGLTTWLSSWLMTRKNVTTDPTMRTQQKIMNITMPLFMAYVTTGLPGGVGLYWITSNICQIVQQVILNRHFEKVKEDEEEKVD